MTNEQRIKLLEQAHQADYSCRALIEMVIADLEHERQGEVLRKMKPENMTQAYEAVKPEPITKESLKKVATAFSNKTPTIPANNFNLQTQNYAGYPLAQCLRGMLKKWESQESGWPVDQGIERQAKTYKVHFNDICSAIATNKQLHAAFMSWPDSGYPEWHRGNEEGAF